MALSYRRLAAVRPANTDEQDLYALTSGEVVGVVHICNQDAGAQTYRIALTDTGAGVAAANEDWLEYETAIAGHTTYKVTIEGMNATSTIRIKSSAADAISFVLMGLLKT